MEFGSKFAYFPDKQTKDDVELVPKECPEVITNTQYDGEDDGQTCMLDVLDTAGQEEYSRIRDLHIRMGDACLVVYSIEDKHSFEEAEFMCEWVKEMKGDGVLRAVLCGNKSDLNDFRAISRGEGFAMARKHGIPFIETSAKDNINVEEAFFEVVRNTPRPKGGAYKITVIGSGSVGKSSLVMRFCNGMFVNDYCPTIEDCYRKQVVVPGIPEDMLHPEKPSSGSKRGGIFSLCFGKKSRKAAKTQKTNNLNPEKKVDMVEKTKANANVMLLQLGTLPSEPDIQTGEPVFCSKCQAALSAMSAANTRKGGCWTCEFCSQENTISLSAGELPSSDVCDYRISPAPDVETELQEDIKPLDSKGTVVYCIDISSSMSTAARVPELQAEWKRLRDGYCDSSGNQYISNLNCVKEAVTRQLERLRIEDPNKKVCIVTFSSAVTVFGDGTSTPKSLPHDLFNNYDRMVDFGIETGKEMDLNSITDSYDLLIRQVQGLSTTGDTALGPALCVCLGLVANDSYSEIVLCTDGEPNNGIGTINGSKSNPEDFYGKIGEDARQRDVKVSIIGTEGTSCGLSVVSECAQLSGGLVNILHPMELTRQLRLIAQNPVIATDTVVALHLHPAIRVSGRNEITVISEVGNVTRESDLTFQFELREPNKELNIKEIPFQVQINYTCKNGMKALRVITKKLKVTKQRENMEKSLNIPVCSISAIHQSSALAQNGDNENAREHLFSTQRLFRSVAKTSKEMEEMYIFTSEAEDLNQNLKHAPRRGYGSKSDNTARLLYKKRNANLAQFLSSDDKKEIIKSRTTTDALKKQYYDYRC